MRKLDLQPTLVGSTITLRPLRGDDFEALYKAAADPGIWEQHPDSSRHNRDVFENNFFLSAIASGGALAVVEADTAEIIGSSRFYEWDREKRELSIGYTFLKRKNWGTGTNREMKKLMLDHAFNHASIVWFHVGKSNLRSRKAIEKLGATVSYEKKKELDGKSFVQLYYKLYAPNWADTS